MSYCSICRRKITRNRTVDNQNICSECIMNLKDHKYNVIIENDNVNYNNDKACSITNNNLEEELIANHVNNQCGVEDTTTGSIEAFKDALIFTITELKDTIQFLRNELEEKNFLVRTLLLRNTNDRINRNQFGKFRRECR